MFFTVMRTADLCAWIELLDDYAPLLLVSEDLTDQFWRDERSNLADHVLGPAKY